MYAQKSHTIDELKANIRANIAAITPEIFENVLQKGYNSSGHVIDVVWTGSRQTFVSKLLL